jgi:hypothetical protein
MEGLPDMIGRFVRVRLAAATPYTMQGEIVDSDRRTC